jgi:hypothetical protein
VAFELVKPRTTRDLFIITQRNAERHPAMPVLTSMIQDAFARRSAPPPRP